MELTSVPPSASAVAASTGAERIGAAARGALLAELAAYPKPGLVSPVDRGAHHDMDHTVMVASVASLTPWFAVLADAGRRSAGIDEHLRPLGQAAEADMLAATGGVNTHRAHLRHRDARRRGRGLRPDEGSPEVTPGDLRAALVARWGDALERHERRRRESASHGGSAMRRHHVRGAAGEAAAGFPAVFEIGVPALSGARSLGLDENAARVQALFVLLAEVPDTNVLHRGGADGQDVVRARPAVSSTPVGARPRTGGSEQRRCTASSSDDGCHPAGAPTSSGRACS